MSNLLQPKSSKLNIYCWRWRLLEKTTAAMSITLKVVYPPGIGFKSKAIKFKGTATVKEAIEEIMKGHKVSIPLDEFVLLLAPPDPEIQKTIWLEESKSLRSYPLQDKVFFYELLF